MSVRKKRKNKVRDPKQVAVSIIEEGRFQREKILGLIEYYSRHSHWTMYRNEFSRPFVNLPSLKDWRGDGVVGTIYTQEERDMEEFSWARQYNQPLFDKLKKLGVDLENCVY